MLFALFMYRTRIPLRIDDLAVDRMPVGTDRTQTDSISRTALNNEYDWTRSPDLVEERNFSESLNDLTTGL
jgi:hypothetical protein